MKRLIPDYYCKSIFDIPMSFFKENNITHVFSDLDNTLDAYNIFYPLILIYIPQFFFISSRTST